MKIKRFFLIAMVLFIYYSCTPSPVYNTKGSNEILTPKGYDLKGFDIKVSKDVAEIKIEETSKPFEVIEGGIGWKCTTNDDCLSGWCIPSANGSVCTEYCVESCPDGWLCKAVVTVGNDPQYICVPLFPSICNPCNDHFECSNAISAEGNYCVSFGADGSFCGGNCDDFSCPPGYVCKDVYVDNKPKKQCMPESGVCECTDYAIKHGLWTKCFFENKYGRCYGKRKCTESGLTECDAKIPQKEICNNIDDNCDGAVDNITEPEICEKTNEFGTCKGLVKCDNGTPICLAEEPQKEICDNIDNDCDGKTDEDFEDTDNDGIKDCLDHDIDNDGIVNELDNCPYTPNKGQEDYDADNIGDMCDDDIDGDGVMNSLDCDPYNPNVFPGNPEKCDGFDNNCNNLTDEGFPDTDNDGISDCVDNDQDGDGDPDSSDCKPFNPNIFNGQVEKCDGIDNNCNGLVDEENADGCHDYYYDGDGDGYGIMDFKCLCKKEGNYTAKNFGDCNDDSPVVYPNAPELCDGIDNNCDGIIDDGSNDTDNDGLSDCVDPDIDNDSILNDSDNCPYVKNTNQSDLDNDGMGDACDTDIDGDGVLNDEDCEPYNGKIFQDNPEVCDGIDNNCNGQTDENLCDDGNECTKDICKPGSGCIHENIVKPCNDNNVCTVNDMCNNGKCVGSSNLNCDDGNPCTVDKCHPISGCYWEKSPDGTPCEDGNFCTQNDKCIDGKCVMGDPVNCDDNNPCTKDWCNVHEGCKHSNSIGACDDNNACTINDKCSNGLCIGTPISCNDSNPCTDDYCDPEIGCVFKKINGACDDGNLCTVGDHCDNGFCIGSPANCDDGNECTEDYCSPDSGCKHNPAYGKPCTYDAGLCGDVPGTCGSNGCVPNDTCYCPGCILCVCCGWFEICIY